MFFFFDPTMIILIPAVILSAWAQYRVSSTFNKYSKVANSNGIRGCDVARKILNDNGLYNVQIEAVRGNLSDHYDPSSKVVRLSESVYGSTSLAALGVAAHEVGHAIQDATDYSPLRWRAALVPVANFGSSFSWILLIIGILLSSMDLAMIGVILFGAVLLFQLVTLPVEFNASSRAMEALAGGGFLVGNEVNGAKKVLNAAALTYVAAVIMSLLQLLRMLAIVFMSNRD